MVYEHFMQVRHVLNKKNLLKHFSFRCAIKICIFVVEMFCLVVGILGGNLNVGCDF